MSSARHGNSIVYSLRTSVLEDIATEVADMARVGRRPAPVRGKASGERRRAPGAA